MISSPSLQRVLITGASGGIGGALALEYAEPGRLLILQGRRIDRLNELAGLCEQRGAEVLCRSMDLCDEQALRITELCVHQPLDLVIVNAGLNTHIGPDGQGEPWEDVKALLQVNLLASMVTVDAVLP